MMACGSIVGLGTKLQTRQMVMGSIPYVTGLDQGKVIL
jgi:hypothetical protein